MVFIGVANRAPSSAFRQSLTYCHGVVVCFRGDAQIYSGTAEHVASAALHKSAIRGVQELRKVSKVVGRIHASRP